MHLTFAQAQKNRSEPKDYTAVHKTGSVTVCKWFGILEYLTVDVLLDPAYMSRYIKGIFPRARKAVPIQSALKAILGRSRDLSEFWSILSYKSSNEH